MLLKMSWKELLFYILAILEFSSVTNATKLQAEGIIEGYEAKPNQFPYQVALINQKSIICGGAIIDDQFILTAAHCVIYKNGPALNETLSVVAGVEDLRKRKTKGVIVPVEKFYVHKYFDPNDPNTSCDIAILKLKYGLGLDENPNLKKLMLPTIQTETYTGKNVKIAGWGWDWIKIKLEFLSIKEEGGFNDFKLKYLNADVLDLNTCQNIYGFKRQIRKSHICAQARQHNKKPSGICSGDSGGPLVFNDEIVIGVAISSGVGCEESYFPGVYTRVSKFLNFIQKAMNDDVSDSVLVYNF